MSDKLFDTVEAYAELVQAGDITMADALKDLRIEFGHSLTEQMRLGIIGKMRSASSRIAKKENP